MKKGFLLLVVANVVAGQSVEQAYFDLAAALQAEGNHQLAIEQYKHVLERNGKHTGALLHLGSELHAIGNDQEAVTYLTHCAKLDPFNPKAHEALGIVLHALNQLDAAADHYRSAIMLDGNESMYCALGDILRKQNKIDQALEQFNKAAHCNPNNIETHFKRANLYRTQSAFDKALTCYDTILNRHQHHPQALLEKAHILGTCGQMDEALSIYRDMLSRSSNKGTLLYNIGYSYKKMGLFDKAIERYNQVLAQAPGHRQALLGLTQSHLALGAYERGWSLMANYNKQDTAAGLFNSIEQMKGKTVLISGELRLEDMLQIVRYAQLLHAQGIKIVLQTPQLLEPLLGSCPYLGKIITIESRASAKIDGYIPLFNLPQLFGTRLETVPATVPYLYPQPTLNAEWACKLKADTNLKVGFYCCNPEKSYDPAEDKNIDFKAFSMLFDTPNISWYCLQDIISEQQLATIPTTCILHTFGPGIPHSAHGIAQAAAIINNLDLIITRDAPMAHIAGALGIPTWLLLPKVANWRWMTERTDSPWYPTMRLFRQKTAGNWENMIHEVTELLKKIQSTPSQKFIP